MHDPLIFDRFHAADDGREVSSAGRIVKPAQRCYSILNEKAVAKIFENLDP